MRINVFPAAFLACLAATPNLQAQSASAMRAICLVQVANADHSIFPLAISDSEAGAKWCQQEIGLPPRVVPPAVVSPATMAQFLAELRTVSGTEESGPARSLAYKLVLLQQEGRREMILGRPTTHDLVKRFEQHCKGTRLHDDLAYIERQLRSPRSAKENQSLSHILGQP